MDSINDVHTEGHNSFCNNVTISALDTNFNLQTKCRVGCSYLNKIYAKYSANEEIKRTACIYMYYWIYYDVLKDGGSDIRIQELYKAILQEYKNNDDNHFDAFMNIFITLVELKKLKDIYDMNTKLENIEKIKEVNSQNKCECGKKCYDLYIKHKDKCKYNSNKDFCNALKKIRDPYNTQMENTNCGDGTPKFLPSFQTRSSINLILTTFVVILVLSIFIIVLHKSIFKSYLRNRIMRKRKQREDIYNECNILQQSELSSNISRNREYNILYYSE